MAALLTENDIQAAFEVIVPTWILEHLDTRLGTDEVVAMLKAQGHCFGSVADCEDGSYPEYARWIDRDARGARVRVFGPGHLHDDEAPPIREGYVAWNMLANRATLAALALRRARGVEAELPAGQLPLFA